MAFPQQFLDELIARNDILDVVSSYVHLTKKGSNYFGLCPFHNEKTPSFSVAPDKQIYHCFGCKKGGGVINFIMEEENLSFPDAVRFLAKRVNLEVPEEQENREGSRLRQRILDLNREAARFYYQLLQQPEGKPVAEYLEQRRIGKKTAVSFGLGASPNSWDALLTASGRSPLALEPKFTCPLCQDTGVAEGKTCQCVRREMQRLRREEIEAMSSLSVTSFDTMKLDYYPNTRDPQTGRTVRQYMAELLADLQDYAAAFDLDSENLMLTGNAGLGKTHAALAVAGAALDKGFDVIYISSPDFFSRVETLHFGSDPAGEKDALLETVSGADLLILDDLGTEFNSSFVISTLYSLLNDRLGRRRPTILTTNITDGTLLEKLYTEKVASRISAFVPYRFLGEDIRLKKAMEE